MYTPFDHVNYNYVLGKLSKTSTISSTNTYLFSGACAVRNLAGCPSELRLVMSRDSYDLAALRHDMRQLLYFSITAVSPLPALSACLCQELRHHLGRDVVINSAHPRPRGLSISSLRPRKNSQGLVEPLKSMVAVQVGVDSTCRS